MRKTNKIIVPVIIPCLLFIACFIPTALQSDNNKVNAIESAVFNQMENAGSIQAIEIQKPLEYQPTETSKVTQQFSDPYYDKQWALQKLVEMPIEYTESETVIAVLDTGIDISHEDLEGITLSSANFSKSNDISDKNGHGTHVAGIIAANINNRKGISSIGSNHKLLNVKVAEDNGVVWPSSIAKGIIWAVDRKAKIINISLCVPSQFPALQQAVDYASSKGVIIIASAGNNASSTKSFPASYTNVISVGATDKTGRLWNNSNNGDWVNLYSPGAEIYSTTPENEYKYMSGTSMASAYVSSVAAHLYSQVSDENKNGKINDEITALLQEIFAEIR